MRAFALLSALLLATACFGRLADVAYAQPASGAMVLASDDNFAPEDDGYGDDGADLDDEDDDGDDDDSATGPDYDEEWAIEDEADRGLRT